MASNLYVPGTTTTVDALTTVASNLVISNQIGFGPALSVSQKGTGSQYAVAEFFDTDISSNVPALMVANGGYVGIGTANPNEKLSIEGSMEIGTSSGDYQHLRMGGGNSSGYLYGCFNTFGDGIHMGYNYYNNNTNDVIPVARGGTSRISMGYGEISLYTGGTGLAPNTLGLFIQNGSVGVGTLGFGGGLLYSALAVNGGTTIGAGYTLNTAPTNGLLVQGNVGIGTTAPANPLSVSGAASVGSGYAGMVAPTNGLLVQGNVGVGTTSPQYGLHVANGNSIGIGTNTLALTLSNLTASIYASPDSMTTIPTGSNIYAKHLQLKAGDNVGNVWNSLGMGIGNVAGYAGNLYLAAGNLNNLPNNGSAVANMYGGNVVVQAGTAYWGGTSTTGIYPGHIRFETATMSNGMDQSTTERMRITSTGYVGIGTTAPAQTLDVVGTAQAYGVVSTGPYVAFDGSATNKAAFLDWLSLATKTPAKSWWSEAATPRYSAIAAGAPGNAAYVGGVLLPDGRVVFVPNYATTIGIFDPSTNAYSTIAGAPGNDAYAGGVLLPDGRVVFVPYNATTIGILSGFPRPPAELCYHPCFNKF